METGALFSTRATEAFDQPFEDMQKPLEHCLRAMSRQLLGVLQYAAENMGGMGRHGSQSVCLHDLFSDLMSLRSCGGDKKIVKWSQNKHNCKL